MSEGTKSEINTAGFKEYLQHGGWDCGVSNVAYIEGIPRDDKNKVAVAKIINELGANKKEGTDILAIEDYFIARPEYDATADTNWTIDGLRSELEKGRVVMVAYQNWQKPKDRIGPARNKWGHYGMVYKIENDRIFMFDPGEKKGWKVLTIADFTERWYELDFSREDRAQKISWMRWALSVDIKAARAWRLAHKTPLM